MIPWANIPNNFAPRVFLPPARSGCVRKEILETRLDWHISIIISPTYLVFFFLTKELKNNETMNAPMSDNNFITYKTYFSIQVCDKYHKQTSLYALYL